MSISYMDGFDHYGTGSTSVTNMLANGFYKNVTSTVAGPTYCGAPTWGTAYTGPYCLVSKGDLSGSKAYAARVATGVNNNVYFISLRYAMDSFPINNNTTTIIDFRNSVNSVLAHLAVTTDGHIQLRNSANTVIGTTTTAILMPQTFHFLEMQWDGIANQFTLRVDDLRANLTPTMTVNNAAISIGSIGSIGLIPCKDANGADAGLFQYQYIDDLIIRSDLNNSSNTWMGDYRVGYVLPDSDALTSNWTSVPGGVPSYNVVGKLVPDDSTYMTTTATSNNTIAFQLSDIPNKVVNIAGISIMVRSWKTDSTTVTYSATTKGVLNNTITNDGFPASSAVSTQPILFNLDPDTGVAISPGTLRTGSISFSRTL